MHEQHEFDETDECDRFEITTIRKGGAAFEIYERSKGR